MIRGLALGLLLVLAGCNRGGVADVTLDADATQRNATAAKTADDLAAATAASRGPAPIVRDAEPVNLQAEATAAQDKDEPTASAATDVQDKATPISNDAAPTDSEATD